MGYFEKNTRAAFFGRTRCGKTHLCKRVQHSGPHNRVFVIDCKNEYQDREYYYIVGYENFKQVLPKLHEYPRFKVCFHFARGEDRVEIGKKICSDLIELTDYMLVIEEVHLMHDPRSKNQALTEISTTKAFQDVGVLFTTQKPSLAPYDLFSECDVIVSGGQHGQKDLAIMGNLIGHHNKVLPSLSARNFIFWTSEDVFYFRT